MSPDPARTRFQHGLQTEFIRRFDDTGFELGVEQHDDGENRSWFVMARSAGRKKWDVQWSTHCGPYSTREQAVDWINAIRETKS